MNKPETIQKFITPGGKEVSTVDEWRYAALMEIFFVKGEESDVAKNAIGLCISRSQDVISILSYKERGRPAGKKDSKPRKAKTVAIGNSAIGTVP